MAYVVWRVFMKKYAKIRLGTNRQLVNPTDRAAICMDSKRSEAQLDELPVEVACEAFDETVQEFAANQSVRKSTKAQRVKSYLKKCKNAALGTSSNQGADDLKTSLVPQDEASNSKQTEHKAQKEVLPNTCWYVADNFESTSDVQDQVPVYEIQPPPPPAEESEIREKDDVNYDLGVPPVTFETCKIRKGNNSSESLRGKVSESSETVPKSRPASVLEPEVCALSDSRLQLNKATSRDVIDGSSAEGKSSDIGSLVDRHLGHLYANFAKSRSVLVRQARDLLVCTYHGNLGLFEKEFLVPAALLLLRICEAVNKDTWDTVVPRGWPLSLGSKGVTLQLGELDPTLLRNRDYYICVRCSTSSSSLPTGGVEAALVWRYHATLGSHTLLRSTDDEEDDDAFADDVETPLRLDMAAAAAVNAGQEARDANNMTGLLQSLLVSVERAIERVSLEDLAFPCPQCHAYMLASDYSEEDPKLGENLCGCQCSCQQAEVVEKKDTSIQTNPLFEFVGSIPHIDSDDDEEGYHDNYRKLSLDSGINTSLAMTSSSPPQEELVPPKSISELDDKWLLSGIHLPGTHDLAGRPVVLYDTLNVSRAALNHRQIASTILYYSTLPSHEKMAKGLTVLVVSGPAEEAALNLLDKAFSLLTKHVKIGCVLVWRQDKPLQHKTSQKKTTLLERSKIQCHVVSDEIALRSFLCEDQTPVTCGGRSNHDQLEWVEFHKELEPLLAQCSACGRRLVEAMSQLRMTEGSAQLTRRQLHHQHRAMARALNDPDIQRLRRDGEDTLRRLGERAQWLPTSEHVRLAMERARRVFAEVEHASRRLEQLSDGRRERLRDLARVRALQDETEQVLSWLCKKGDETLGKHSQLATSLSAIKLQEQDFEKFYFISMRHLDKGSDLVEAASQCPGEVRSDGSRGSLKDLARSLKQHLRGFGERLEDTRERLEDTSRCFYLLDKAYEWALEAMKYMSRVGAVDEVQTPEQALQMLKLIQQYLMAHPVVSEEHFSEMLQLSAKVGNDKLQQQAKVAHSRCQETMESIRTQQNRLVQLRKMFGGEEEGCQRPASPKGWKPACSTPVSSDVGRRRSVGSVPYIFKCNHHAAGHACSCWDPSPAAPEECCCTAANSSTRNNLGNIQEVRESAEDLLDACTDKPPKDEEVCTRCHKSAEVGASAQALKRQLRRSCTWQYPTENFDEEDASRLSAGSGDEHKCEYSTDNSGDNTTEGSDGCAKSGENGDDPYEQEICNKSVPPVSVNSHLHCNASNLDLSNSLAEPGSKEQKTHKTLLYIMREMIQTERDYVNSLEYIIENYIPELLREDIPQALRGQRNVIFGNVEKIYEFHSQYFLRELEKCENSPLLIGQSFLTHEKKFYLYALYNKNKPKSDAIMSEYGTTFFKTKQLELGDKMDLASYLLKPVQRMGKYALLLQQLVKASADKSAEPDVTDMKAADKMVRFQLRHGNDLLAMDSLRDCDINVKEQGRLLRQNEFLVWQGKGKKCLRHVFLFEDLILFSKARRFPDRKNLDLYIYKNSIKMTDIGLTAKIGDSPTKFEIWFRKRKPNDTFTLQSMSEEIKQSWTEELSKLLWSQALRNRESRLAEMSSMGIGNKPCLDIRPSADQISDRSISIAQLSKTAPRFRNSISAPPGELTRGNKRPHSIISVSSSSSSGGSSSGASHTSNFGALNLGFDPADSPRLHHRSATLNSQCSMESGIIADISLGSEDTDSSGTHWGVERSNSSATTGSANSAVSPTSPLSPLTESKPLVENDQNDFFNIKL